MNDVMTGGSLTTASPGPTGLWWATSASAAASITASPWNQMSPVSSSTYTAGHPLSGVSGVKPTKFNCIRASESEVCPCGPSSFKTNPDGAEQPAEIEMTASNVAAPVVS